MRVNRLVALALTLVCAGGVPHTVPALTGSFQLTIGSGPYVSGSRVLITTQGAAGRIAFSLDGPGEIRGSTFVAPSVTAPLRTGIIAASTGAIAYTQVSIVPAPAPGRPLIAVASYDRGIALHDPKTFALLGYAGIGGPPGDVAFTQSGDLLAPDTDGNTLARFTRSPWTAHWIAGVASGNEVAVDERTGDAFVSDRDINGDGALTRISADGRVDRVVTGLTAEGLAVDEQRDLVYAGNVNDATVAEVDARTLAVRRKLHSPLRTFGIALDGRIQRLFVVANISSEMRSGKGYVSAIDLNSGAGTAGLKSAGMQFPLGVALDQARARLYVTDESADLVYVLNERTLTAMRAPLRTCRTPWRPRIVHDRLYVPCARANAVDVFDARTLRRVRGVPFSTGGFPLSVAVWP